MWFSVYLFERVDGSRALVVSYEPTKYQFLVVNSAEPRHWVWASLGGLKE